MLPNYSIGFIRTTVRFGSIQLFNNKQKKLIIIPPLLTSYLKSTRKGILSSQYYHTTSTLYLNRFLFDISEISNNTINLHDTNENDDNDDDDTITGKVLTHFVTIPKDDYRTIHAARILQLQNGDTIRCGIVSCTQYENGLVTDDAIIQWLPEGKVKKAMPLGNGQPPGSLQIRLYNLQSPTNLVNLPITSSSSSSSISVLLALPRPLQLNRILPMISQMGIDKLYLTQAHKVPKDYFGSHLLRTPQLITDKLIEGLCQSGDVRIPKVHIIRNLSLFVQNDIDTIFPVDTYARVIAHPQRIQDTNTNTTNNPGQVPVRMKDVQFPKGMVQKRIVLAIGPEGGWDEPDEINMFLQKQFQQITLGPRILRSDVAVISLVALANDICTTTTI